jgi:hypothetical protein
MNTGIQDAANLGWKLAATIKGTAPDGLLDTYQNERHPVGRMVLRSSGAIIRMAMVKARPARVARNLVAGSLLKLDSIARKATGIISGIGIDYPAPKGAHGLTGQRAADIPLAGGGRLYEALRDGRFVVVTAGATELTAPWADRITIATPADPTTPTVLVRPDAYVAWADDHPDSAHMAAALTTWCGAGTVSADSSS